MMLHDLTLTSYQIKFKCMLCYLNFASCNKDDAALLNVNFISNKMSLVRKLGSCFFPKIKGPENHNSNGPKWKKAGPPANTNTFKAFESWLLQRSKTQVLNSCHSEQFSNSTGSLLAPVPSLSEGMNFRYNRFKSSPKLVDVGRSSWGIFSQGRGGFAFEGWWMQCLPRRLGTVAGRLHDLTMSRRN